MKKIIKVLFSELNIAYHHYLFEPTNRKQLVKFLIYCFIGSGCWLWGYKWRDTKIIIQNFQINQLSKRKAILKENITKLQNDLDDYNFMIEDGDYYRYLAFKHGEILIPKETKPEDLKLITEQSIKFEIPFKYIYRLIWQESHYKPNAQSSMGAQGYMQVMPATFTVMKKMYEDTFNITIGDMNKSHQNIIVGTYLLKYLYERYNNWPQAIAAYNAGSGNVDGIAGIPNIPETQKYVKFIINK